MYISQLQELCQKKSCSLPVYDSVKDGPDPRPFFTATVTVNDTTFESPIQCRSSKEAQNAAAQVALNKFSSLHPAPQQQSMISPVQKYSPSGSLPSTTNLDTKTAKSGEVEQKKDGLLLAGNPTSIEDEECLVIITVDGNTSETPNHFSTLKDVEHGAANVAFESMSLHLTEEDKVLYKTLLQEHAQRKGLRFPIYDTQRSGPVHTSLFVSRVEIGDKSFQGQEAKTKKMAEMNAAKAAYICLTKCQKSQSSNYSAGETSEVSSFNLQPNVTGKVEEAVARKSHSQSSNFSGGKTLEVSTLNLQPDVRGKLQELCQKKSWSLPVYDSVKDGPDHQPRFTATVTINDATFESPIQCRSSKEAQNAAAQVALNNFSSLHPAPQQQSMISPVQKYVPSGSLSSTTNLDTKTAKNGEVEQKKDGLLLAGNPPSIEEEECLVIITVDGNTSETPNHFSTPKDAEHGAAKVVFESMSLHLTEEDKVLYKTLLQEHAQRKGLRFPIYDTQRSGPLHTPLFLSRVEIGDKSFQGQVAKTKKMAEMNAAKAAYICLTECQKSQSSNYSAGETSEVSSFNLQPNVTGKVEEAVARKSNSQSSNFSGGKTLEVSALNLQPDVRGKLQELCQKKSWSLPVYDSVKDGPDHQPRFTATVTVNDATFESPIQCRSSKEAQNAAAQVALNSLSSLHPAPQQQSMISPVQKYVPSGSLPLTTNLDTKTAKSGEVEQKKDGLLLAGNPTSIEEEGCLVIITVDGNTSETPNHFSTPKDAEHGAAKVAFESMSLHLTEEDKVLYKTLLQEHAQRKGLCFPIYDTQRSGPVHTPLFVSRVEIGDKSFQGQEAKTKKMAEMNAAKAEYICLTKCQKSQSSNYSGGETSEVSSFNLQPNVTGKVEEAVARKSHSQSSNFSGGKTLEVSTLNLQPDVRGKVEVVARKNNIVSKEQAHEIQDNNAKRHRNSTTSEDAHDREQGSSIAKSPPQDSKDGASLPTLDIIVPPARTSVKRILVSPRTPNMIIPEGVTILPSSNDQWVAVAMTVPEEEYEKYYN